MSSCPRACLAVYRSGSNGNQWSSLLILSAWTEMVQSSCSPSRFVKAMSHSWKRPSSEPQRPAPRTIYWSYIMLRLVSSETVSQLPVPKNLSSSPWNRSGQVRI